MSFLYTLMSWVLGAFFLIVSILASLTSPIASIPLFLIPLLLLPPIRKFAHKKTQRKISTSARSVITVFLLLAFGMINPWESANKDKEEKMLEFAENRASILEESRKQLAAGNYQAVLDYYNEYSFVEDQEFSQIGEEAGILKAENEVRIESARLTSELESLPETETRKLLEIYEKLSGYHPDNTAYAANLQKYSEIVRIENEKLAESQAKREMIEAQAQQRVEMIEAQFSIWDGSHRNLTKMIKNAMHDSDSYEHVATARFDRGDYLQVQTTYRGKNLFGAVVTNSVQATVSLSGTVLSIDE